MPKVCNKLSYVSKWVGDILHIYDFVYGQNFFYVEAVSEEQFAAIIKKALKFDLESGKYKDGGFKVIEKEGILVGLLWGKRREVITHECFHAVAWTLRNKGIELSESTDEAYAYYMQFLSREIFRNLGGRKNHGKMRLR